MLLLWIEGMCAIGAGVNAPAWFTLLFDRLRASDRPKWSADAYLFVRGGMALGSLCVAFAYGYYTWLNMGLGPVDLQPVWLFMLFNGGLAVSEGMFVRGAFILGRQRPWHIWLGLCAGWTVVCLWRVG